MKYKDAQIVLDYINNIAIKNNLEKMNLLSLHPEGVAIKFFKGENGILGIHWDAGKEDEICVFVGYTSLLNNIYGESEMWSFHFESLMNYCKYIEDNINN